VSAHESHSLDSIKCRQTLEVGGKSYDYFSLLEAEKNGLDGISRLPFSLKVLLENLLRHEDGSSVTADDIRACADWLKTKSSKQEIAYRPARVLMQDFTGVPAVVDLTAMRDAMVALGGDAAKINPLVPVDLVIDHSVMVDFFGTGDAFKLNVDKEYERNQERYSFLRWGAGAFDNFRVVPPGTGICHQVNLEYLAQTVWTKEVDEDGKKVTYAYPDTLVGTDSHTTMINALSVLGWGVGGIEAEAAMLGQPISMLFPEVVGFRLEGELPEGITATDLVLTVVQLLRARGVVGKFVEFYGPGLDHLSLEDQATIANMAPEYGATCGFFPIDSDSIAYLKATGRAPERIALVEAYAKAQGMWRDNDTPDPVFTDTLGLDLSTVEPSIAGPKRPQDRVALKDASQGFAKVMDSEFAGTGGADKRVGVEGRNHDLGNGDVVIAAITSCTNTSNPAVLIAAGLVARNAHARGLKVKPWVRTSFAPGSQVVTDYLERAGLQGELDALGFNLVGYGCTTCIGNSGPLPEEISEAIGNNDLVVASVLSGNRNFEGRINPNPSTAEISELIRSSVTPEMFASRYGDVFKGDEHWQKIGGTDEKTYDWPEASTYVKNPPYFEDMQMEPAPVTDIIEARVLGLFQDSITTDHISPAGAIQANGPAGSYLVEHQVRPVEFNSFGARRGNHHVMMRGTFGNVRIKNQMVVGTEGGVTIHYPSGDKISIFEAAMRYKSEGVPLVVFAGKEYGTGSSRDWAAKGTLLLGIRAVIVESFERIHRSNLVGMGVLPLQFEGGESWQGLGITGAEKVTIEGLEAIEPGKMMTAKITFADGSAKDVQLLCRIDTEDELAYYRNGGILPYVLRNLAKAA
jgi:aconitate hydratase